jgi:putative molybdopterin biosynthesis protein
MHEYLTTKEVADLLRIKERTLYELCADGVLPVTRVTGKLIFPRTTLMSWLRQNTDYGRGLPSLRDHPSVVAGSHDLLLEWAIRSSGSGLATYFNGSEDGLQQMKQGKALCAGIHFHGADNTNANVVCAKSELPYEPVVLVEWAKRNQGLVMRPDLEKGCKSVADIRDLKVIMRQKGSGSQVLFESALRQAGLTRKDVQTVSEIARSETDVAQAIANGHADVGFSIEAAARQYRLAFIPLVVERFDLLVWRRDYFEEPMQRVLTFCRTEAFHRHAAELGGYDVSGNGTIHYNGA